MRHSVTSQSLEQPQAKRRNKEVKLRPKVAMLYNGVGRKSFAVVEEARQVFCDFFDSLSEARA